MFGQADVNSFYASCRTFFSPGLHSKPVIVISNNDGGCNRAQRRCKSTGHKNGRVMVSDKESALSHKGLYFQFKLQVLS
jgi:DNA polymerase V